MNTKSFIRNVSIAQNKINLNKTQYEALKHLIPEFENNRLTFEIVDSNCAVANGLRRTIMTELPIRHMTVSMNDIKTTDMRIVGDIVLGRIEMIPIPQNTPLGSMYSLKFENLSDTFVDVNSSEIKQRGSSVNGMMSTIPICSINARHSISISDITVVESYGYINGRASLGRVSYEILNHDMDKNLSTTSNPSHFKLTIEMPGNVNVKEHVIFAINNICSRLDAIDIDNHTTEFNTFKLLIPNETHTIGNLITAFIFKIQPGIEYVAMRCAHPSKRECVIDIVHPQAAELCKRAIQLIKTEYQGLIHAFE